MQAFRRRRPANQNAVAANNTARQPAVIATTSVSTRSEPLGEPETGEQRGAMAVFLAVLHFLHYLLTYFLVGYFITPPDSVLRATQFFGADDGADDAFPSAGPSQLSRRDVEPPMVRPARQTPCAHPSARRRRRQTFPSW